MSEEGEGDLYRKFEKLKKKLKEEGLFEKEAPIPKYPKKIGVITSPKGAVIHDIITTIKRRWPYIEIILWPTMVQGDDAKISVSRNINLANETDVDLLIVCRGGGSIEDLWCFNEEIVARAIFNSKIPIISAVGHESDTTIADFVADRRAPTPTAAAELAVPNVFEIRNQLISNEIRLNKTILNQIEYLENNLNRIKENHLIVNPIKLYETKTEKLDILWERLNRAMKNYMKTEVKNLSSLNEKLILLNPLGTIERGYSVVKDSKTDKIISSVKNLNIGDNINIELKDGYIKTNIDDIKEK
jgi:exodeoxyribonuclease VII large subunit